ncbi:MAG: hypothetical protein EHM55_21715 [Acidobacteria bacterium]|nr:MAG: hypothetical protein EHM55_21715 [Acidobacteriota bacterium]
MIGVAAKTGDLPWVTEFFELFKTPWEPLVRGKRYDVVLSTGDDADTFDAALALVYGARELPIDRRSRAVIGTIEGPVDIQWEAESFPIYTCAVSFSGPVSPGALLAGTAAIDYRHTSGATTLYRIGYGLFEEVAHLLTRGQPPSYSQTPTLELHIELIRRCLRESGVSYVEIPARPHQSAFICCLTHDIDFYGIRGHAIDRTVVGFAIRGTFGTLVDLLRGRRRLDEALRNWLAVLSLPFVWLGLASDFWGPFGDYARAEQGRHSTFFVIPFKGQAGANPDGATRARRAAPYAIQDIRNDIEAFCKPGTEFAVHGIDAWRDADAGRSELQELTRVTGQQTCGIRMHWLYFSDRSPQQLEDAGYEYDSTWGYNDAVGYRAGTSQVFRLQGTEHLLELPLTIMDSALFYPDRMNLDQETGMARCQTIVERARRFGGALVINWHDRSLAPERQWRRCHEDLLSKMQEGVWFATAGEAVEWFRWRRTIRFSVEEGTSRVLIEAPTLRPRLPAACVTVHRAVPGKVEVDESSFSGGVQSVCSDTLPANQLSLSSKPTRL